MRCVVTGASGFVGSWLTRSLVEEGHEVLGIVRQTSDLTRLESVASRITLLRTSLQEIKTLEEEIREFKPEVVFHLAWWGGNSRKYVNDPAQIYTNLPGSLELVRIAGDCGCDCFVFLGSCVEYGQYNIPVNEADRVAPQNLYGWAKYGTELLSAALCASLGIRFCGVRLFWAYGPMDDELRMIPSVITKLLRRERPSLTAGEQLWDFVYIEDVVDALIQLALRREVTGTFNCGSGESIAIRHVVETIRDVIDPSLCLGFGDVPYAPDQVMHLKADIGRLTRATGWRPTTSLNEGLRKTVEWYRTKQSRMPRK
jgi:nucleoside-diphosphate-sugar epimerase